MNSIHEKILQYFKKYNVGDVSIRKLTDEEEKEKEKAVLTSTTNSEIKTEKVNASSSNDDQKQQLKNKLTVLDEQLKGTGDGNLLQKIEYQPLTEEEIKTKASQGVDEKYNLKLDDVAIETDKKLKDLEEQTTAIEQNAKAQKQKIEALYKDAEQKVESSAIKRGISRSSIVQEQLKSLDVEKISNLLSVDESVATKLKETSDKIKELENDYLTAINKLNVEKALEISDKIEELTEKQNEKLEEVLKYNNTVTRQEAQLEKKGVPNPSKEEKRKIQQDMLTEALNYYYSLPKETAYKEFLKDAEIQYLLGDVSEMVEKYLKVL